MPLDLFAGIPVSDYEAARPWYERLLGGEPSFIAHATEAVWELAEHRSLFIVEDAGRVGREIHTVFVDDLDARVADIASRGVEPDERVTHPGKARKGLRPVDVPGKPSPKVRCRVRPLEQGTQTADPRITCVERAHQAVGQRGGASGKILEMAGWTKKNVDDVRDVSPPPEGPDGEPVDGLRE